MKAREKLRTGFTTGTATVGAALSALKALYGSYVHSSVTVEAPCGELSVPIAHLFFGKDMAEATVIKDGGDDPDCTHGLRLVARVYKEKGEVPFQGLNELKISEFFQCYTGEGIGIVTKEGLPVNVGEPAVNPVPRKMLKENLEKAIKALHIKERPIVILSVPEGKEAAKHTLNARLGIIDGISILGTTGIVKPISMDAFTATIDLSLNIAKKRGLKKVVLCFGRTSEEGAKAVLDYPEEAFVMMGDFFSYAVKAAKKKRLDVTVAGQLAKLLKVALGWENTNVKYAVFSPKELTALLSKLSMEERYIKLISEAHTARHIFEIVEKNNIEGLWERLVKYIACQYKIKVLLFSYRGELLARA